MMMSEDDLLDVATRLSLITPGPWVVVGLGRADHGVCRDNGDGTARPLFDRVDVVGGHEESEHGADAEFVANAPEDVRRLLALVGEQAAIIHDAGQDSGAWIGERRERARVLRLIARLRRDWPASRDWKGLDELAAAVEGGEDVT